MNESEALYILEIWLREYGVKEVSLLSIDERESYFEVQSLSPNGLFFIDKTDGEIIDEYETFEKNPY